MTRILILMQLVALAAYAAGPPLNDYATPFDGKDCEVIWQAATNYPAFAKVFAVVPAKFSETTVSNLLEMAELKPHQRKRVNQTGVFAGADVRFFADRMETRQVNLIPSQGFVVLNREGTEAKIPKEKPVGVPTDKEAFNLATNLMHRLGYKVSELVPMFGGECGPSSSDAIVLSKNKGSGQMVTNIVSRTIHLCRQLDGIPVTGGAGVEMKFGNEGKLGYLSIVWRSVKPERDCPVPDASGFVKHIKSGRAQIYETQAWKPYQKLTIKKVSLYYWESEGAQFQTTIYPFAVLEAETDLSGEDSKARLFVQFASE